MKNKYITIAITTIILAIVCVCIKTTTVQAQNSESIINFSKLGEEKIVEIMLPKDSADRKITKQELIAQNNKIVSIKTKIQMKYKILI